MKKIFPPEIEIFRRKISSPKKNDQFSPRNEKES